LLGHRQRQGKEGQEGKRWKEEGKEGRKERKEAKGSHSRSVSLFYVYDLLKIIYLLLFGDYASRGISR